MCFLSLPTHRLQFNFLGDEDEDEDDEGGAHPDSPLFGFSKKRQGRPLPGAGKQYNNIL